MIISSWNVNSVRARIENIKSYLLKYKPDVVMMQEIKTSGTDWQKHADEFFNKMKSFEGVRLPGERRHKNRLNKGPRNINEELVNKIKSLS